MQEQYFKRLLFFNIKPPAMKKSIFFNGTVLLFAFLFFNFQKAPSAPPTNIIIDFDLEEFVNCANGGAGEVIELSGSLHVLIVSNVNNNRVSGISHFQPQGVQGTGQSTGDLYNATGITQDHFSGSLVNGQYTATFINNYRLIGQGPGNNYLIHQTVHVTFNANGEPTASVDNTTIDCK
jgi:hypothetical protein